MEENSLGGVDLHCHLLPGIDDGPSDWEMTLAMARCAVADGITAIVATPHWPLDGHTAGPLVRELAVEAQQRLRDAGIPLRVLPGHELQIVWELDEALASGDALPLGDSHFLLLETPYFELPLYLRDLLFRLQSQGYRPILGHPERNARIQEEPERLEEFINAGCLVQINGGSVLGQLGPRSRRAAAELLKRGYVQFISSDAHSDQKRPPVLAAAARAASRWVGHAAAQSMIAAAPFSVVQDIMPLPVRVSGGRGLLPGLMQRLRSGPGRH